MAAATSDHTPDPIAQGFDHDQHNLWDTAKHFWCSIRNTLDFPFEFNVFWRCGSNGVRIRTIFERLAASEVSLGDLGFMNYFKWLKR